MAAHRAGARQSGDETRGSARRFYVHAKACVIDDVWASAGSDNFKRRSWAQDSELSCAVLDETPDLRQPRTPRENG